RDRPGELVESLRQQLRDTVQDRGPFVGGRGAAAVALERHRDRSVEVLGAAGGDGTDGTTVVRGDDLVDLCGQDVGSVDQRRGDVGHGPRLPTAPLPGTAVAAVAVGARSCRWGSQPGAGG